MGESRKKSTNLRSILANAKRCIYCANVPDTIEHMPPRSLFVDRQRPSGLEYPCCKECNNKTRAADSVAALFSRIARDDNDASYWDSGHGRSLLATVDRDAPGLREEISRSSNPTNSWHRTKAGLLKRVVVLQPQSPMLRSHLDVFSAKMGMALYSEHVGEPLPIGGAVQFSWFLNTGLNNDQARAMLTILPTDGELKQGTFTVRNQFAYRYNSDEKSIVAALIGLSGNLHIFAIASGTPEKFKMPMDWPIDEVASGYLRPGELVGHLSATKSAPRLRILR